MIPSILPSTYPEPDDLHPCGLDVLTVVERMSFNLGSAVRALWLATNAPRRTQYLESALFHLDRDMALAPRIWVRPQDPDLREMALRIQEAGGWNGNLIWHILVAVQSGNPTHLRAAHNGIFHLLHHPQEMRDAPRPRL